MVLFSMYRKFLKKCLLKVIVEKLEKKQGSHVSWKVLDFSKNFQVLEIKF